MKTKKIALTALFAVQFGAYAQWTEVASFNQVMIDLRSFDNKLFVGGTFTQCEGSTSYWSAFYNGVSMVNQTTLIGGTGINGLAVFNGELYATGGMDIGGTTGVAKWSGTNWVSGGSFTVSHSGIFADGSDLYVGSDFSDVSKKTGVGAFTSMPSMDGANDEVYAINKYNGTIIIAGDLNLYNGSDLNNIASWDGTNWQPIGGGLSGEVRCLAVYNGELYAGGKFATAGGVPAKNIAKWDGTSWSAVGGSVSGTSLNGVRDMVVHDNKLYVVGDFSQMGTTPAGMVASWDGTSWTAHDLTTTSNFANCIEVHNDKLYVGTFSTSSASLYSMDLPSSAGVHEAAASFGIYPNPASTNITIHHSLAGANLNWTITNMDGQIIATDRLTENTLLLPGLEPGVYLLYLTDLSSDQRMVRKFIVD